MNRRTVLTTTGIGVALSLGGCLSSALGGSSGPPDRPWTPSAPVTEPDGTHHLFVENLTESTERAWLRVVRADDATLVDGRYELPAERGFKFEAIAAWERTYTIDLAIDGDGVVSRDWYTAACGATSESPGDSGSRNGSLRVKKATQNELHQVSLVVDECDTLFAPDVSIGPAEAFRLDE